MRKTFILLLLLSILICKSIAQEVSLTGKVINPSENPIENVLVYLASNPVLYSYSDSLGKFSITDQLNTSVPEVRQNEFISFENRKLSIYANNQSISVDVINLNGSLIKNILNLNKSFGTVELFPEAYISDQPKAMYIVRARVGNNFRSFKIQNLIPSYFPEGIITYDFNNLIDKSLTEPVLKAKSAVSDTLIFVHDFYKSRNIPLDSYNAHFDSIHLNNFTDYTVAEGFEPSVTQLYNRYANFTDVISADSVQFIIDYDTLSVLEGNLKVITIPIDKIENLDNSIEFISGLHFEPSGTKFLQPVQVSVFLKDPIPDDLVVFHYNDQGETNYIPYDTLLNDGHSIIFNVHHFSSIGIGTGEIPAANPEEFTTTEQFISYFALLINNNGTVPDGFYTMWFVNVILPKIYKISSVDDLETAMTEFATLESYYQELGEDFKLSSLYLLAIEKFSEAMELLYEHLVKEYNAIDDDNCLKLEIITKTLRLQTLQNYFPDLYELDINRLNNGEYWRFPIKIEFPKSIKTLDIGASYKVEYSLISPSDSVIPDNVFKEELNWSSSNPAVATVDSTGMVNALSDGTTTIQAELCTIKSSMKVIVGNQNCEENYCIRSYGCYDGIYKGEGTLNRFFVRNRCKTDVTERISVLTYLNLSDAEGYFARSMYYEKEIWDNRLQGCRKEVSMSPSTNWGVPYLYCDDVGHFGRLLQPYIIDARLSGESLILDVSRYDESVKRYFRTRIYCTRVD